jgi:hypothetical protein
MVGRRMLFDSPTRLRLARLAGTVCRPQEGNSLLSKLNGCHVLAKSRQTFLQASGGAEPVTCS